MVWHRWYIINCYLLLSVSDTDQVTNHGHSLHAEASHTPHRPVQRPQGTRCLKRSVGGEVPFSENGRTEFENAQTSNFAEDNRKIEMDTRVIQLYHSLRCQILLNSFELGLFTAIFCYNCLFVEFMGQVAVLIQVQGASSRKHKRCCTWETQSGHWWLIFIFDGVLDGAGARERPISPGFGATHAHLQLWLILFLVTALCVVSQLQPYISNISALCHLNQRWFLLSYFE